MEPAEYQAMDAAEATMWWYRALHARLLSALSSVPAGARVVDLGCGTGGFLSVLSRARPDLLVAGLEWDESAARRAGDKSRSPVTRGTVTALPFRDASFDAAVLADVLSHAAVDPARALAEAIRVLRPGGRLVVNMPAYAWLLSAHDRRVGNARRMTARQLSALVVAAGFAGARARYWNGLLLPAMIARRLVWRRGEQKSSDVAPFPPWLDRMCFAATEIERRLALPAGGSTLLTATRP